MQRNWDVQEVRNGAVVLRVRSAMPARELLQQLLASKEQTRKVLARGGLRRQGVALLGSDELLPSDDLELIFMAEEQTTASDGPVQVIYQDRLLMAVDKPAGILVHSDGTGADTLTARVQALLLCMGTTATAQAVQRLDVGTSGLVLFSLTREFQPALDAQVAGHDMRKRYLAVVEGTSWPRDGELLRLDWPIGRDRHDAQRMRVGRGGKPSVTLVRVLSRQHGKTLLQVELQTGRRHQTRVHLAHAGHPIVGDTLYGGRRCGEGLMLHAWQERVVHPLTGETIELETQWPERFARMGFARP